VAKVEIDGALGDAGAFCNVVEPRRLEAARGELVERRGENGLAPRDALRLALAGARRFGGWRGGGAWPGRIGRGLSPLLRPPFPLRCRDLAPGHAFSRI